MKDLLDRLEKAVNAATEGSDSEGENQDEQTVEMTPTDFVKHIKAEIEKAEKDPVEVRKARLALLSENIKVAKEYEGRPATPGGMFAVKMFTDPAQVKTTEKTVPATGALTHATPFSQNAVPDASAGAGNGPSGQMLPPATAPGSGFETPANATFAKALETIDEIVKSISNIASGEPAKAGDEVSTNPEDEKGDGVQKSAKGEDERAVWPADMNSPFGLGETKDPEMPEWGLDGQPFAE